ncbi:MAG: protoporphyrinogen oxidase HemJ [Alphaproteobacteria bacterium]|nr:protoporphyrinogen oxidase HemJ [Alphaproteobacteria bacterium]
MQQFLYEHYLGLKALHIIAMVAWMAGMFYLPRLYVYHVKAAKGGELSETLKVMERRLLRIIINPAMIVTWLCGGLMIWANPSIMQEGWIHVKLTALLLMQIVHAMLARHRKQFLKDANAHSERYYRIINEVPTVLLVIIVIMVVVRPF